MTEQRERTPEKTLELPQLGKEIVVLMGPEGSGKSMIGRRLAEATNKPYIYTGDILRNLAANDQGPWGDACRKMFEAHTYLDPGLTLEIIKDRLERDDTANGFILDGGLRTTAEAMGFQDVLRDIDRLMPISVVHLRIPPWEGYLRLKQRGRADDTDEGIFSRFSNYYNSLGERASFFNKEDGFQLLHVNGMGSKDEAFARACKALQARDTQY